MDALRDCFERWSREVNAILTRGYCITVEDAGFSAEDLRRYYAQEPDAREFVRWFATKYELSENRVY
jgi:hypothetical protein